MPISYNDSNNGDSVNLLSRKQEGKWTEEEHEAFLIGMEKVGRNWTRVSKEFVLSRTPTQITSHAQKYFEGLRNDRGPKRSVFDITLERQSTTTCPESVTKAKQVLKWFMILINLFCVCHNYLIWFCNYLLYFYASGFSFQTVSYTFCFSSQPPYSDERRSTLLQRGAGVTLDWLDCLTPFQFGFNECVTYSNYGLRWKVYVLGLSGLMSVEMEQDHFRFLTSVLVNGERWTTNMKDLFDRVLLSNTSF